VFATADILAIGIMEGLVDSGYDVPGQVSVLGFDNLDLSEYVTPKLTTIAQDIPRKAEIAVRLLLDAIEGKDHPADPITLDVELIERGSTASPPFLASPRLEQEDAGRQRDVE
jgi:LacI family transcriptional regulator